jgi:hypothetical protein
MAGERQTVHDLVLEEYDNLYGSRPDTPEEVILEADERSDAAKLVERLRDTLGIDDTGQPPEGTLADLIDYLHERWDGVTMEPDGE